jgi:DNA polymerase-1
VTRRYLDTALLDPDDDAALGPGWRRPTQPKALHEAKLARHDLAGRGWRLDGVTSDTALAAYLVRPGQRSFALDDLSLRYLGRELRAEDPGQQQLSLLDDTDGADDQAAATLMLRARAVVDLADALDGELAKIDESRRCSPRWNCRCSRAGRAGGRRHRGRPRPAVRAAEPSSPARSATPPRPPTW